MFWIAAVCQRLKCAGRGNSVRASATTFGLNASPEPHHVVSPGAYTVSGPLDRRSWNEQGYTAAAVERQLSHDDDDKVRAAYNAAEYLPERRAMLQWFADHLDAVRQRDAV